MMQKGTNDKKTYHRK